MTEPRKPLKSVTFPDVEMVDVKIRNIEGHAWLFLEDGRMLRGQLPTDHYFYVGDPKKGEIRQATFRPQFLVEDMERDTP